MAEKRERLYVYLNPDAMEKFRDYSKRLGLTLSQFGNLCITAGMNSITRILEPEKVLSVEDWQRVIEASKRAGLKEDEIDDMVKKIGTENVS